MTMKAKHAFGALERVDEFIANGVLDAHDVLFVKDADGKPYIGWVDKDGSKVIVDNKTDLSGIETELATKVNAEEVDAKIGEAKAYTDGKIESAINEHMVKKYEITDVPEGTLIDYREKEIRVMCPENSVFTKQSVGTGGDANSYYMTFKTYVYDDNVVGYKEHLDDQVDAEILTDLKTDKYGHRYQPTWLALAKYDEATDTWTYYGANSSRENMTGWDYQIDWFNVEGVLIASDRIRINLSNEQCHSSIEPYYVNGAIKTANAYTDEQIKEKLAEVGSAYEVIEF